MLLLYMCAKYLTNPWKIDGDMEETNHIDQSNGFVAGIFATGIIQI